MKHARLTNRKHKHLTALIVFFLVITELYRRNLTLIT